MRSCHVTPYSPFPRCIARCLATAIAAAYVLSALGCREDAETPTAPAPPMQAATASAAVALAFHQVDAGAIHSCGVTTDEQAYCWGSNVAGELGDGTATDRLTPVAVVGGLRFRNVSAGEEHSCGVTTDNVAYCWGFNGSGQVGDGTTTRRSTPVPVAGGHLFRQVSAGTFYTCGVTYPDNLAYCWGRADYGQLGAGDTFQRLTPVAVHGGHLFRQVSAGSSFDGHTCGVTPTNQAYCWGSNRYGQLGDSSTAKRRVRPVLVAGGHQFIQVAAGFWHTCAVTTTNQAFCWGNGTDGQIGNGKTYLSFWPRKVAGGLTFLRVTAGFRQTCGVTTDNLGYCWGSGSQLGNGTTTMRVTPVAVAGGLRFAQLSADESSTCGTTLAAVAYCWGINEHGQLGDGTTTDRLTPTAVAGPS
jgi:alpha-tubulin suppressor-like RCC1 family protein